MTQNKTSRGDMDYAQGSPRELVENLRDMIDEAEKMIVQTATAQVDETVGELREQLQERLDHLKAAYEQAEDRLTRAATATDHTIREKPYQSVGIAVGVGVLLGILLNRKK